MTKLDIRNLQNINGDIVELQKVNRKEVEHYRDDCKNHITHINRQIENLEEDKRGYLKEITLVDKLFRKETK